MRPIQSKARDGTDAGGYRTREVAELTDLGVPMIRRFVQHGLIEPTRGKAGEFHFSFQDMVLLRTAKGLLDANVSSRRTLAALLKLRDRLREEGAERPLSAMRIFADGNTVVVREMDALWDVETGQGHFAFDVEHLAGDVRKLATRNLAIARQSDDLDSDDWYNFGLDLEEVSPDKAPEAYTRSINLNPPTPMPTSISGASTRSKATSSTPSDTTGLRSMRSRNTNSRCTTSAPYSTNWTNWKPPSTTTSKRRRSPMPTTTWLASSR